MRIALLLPLWALLMPGFLTFPGSALGDPTPPPLTRENFPQGVSATLARIEGVLKNFENLSRQAARELPDLKGVVVDPNYRAAQKLYEYAKQLGEVSLEKSRTLKPGEIVTSPSLIPEWRMLNTVFEQVVRLYEESYQAVQRLKSSEGTTPTTTPVHRGAPSP